MDTNSTLLNISGEFGKGVTETWVHLNPNLKPVGSYTLEVTTTYDKARDPSAHQKKFSMVLADADMVNHLADFLKSSVS